MIGSKNLRHGLPFLVMLALPASVAAAQQGPGRFADQEHRYDVDTVETVTGTVDEVLLRTGRAGAAGLHLLISAGEEQLEVLVGPTFYVYPAGLEVDPGDEVTVTGSRITVDGQPQLMAREIRVGTFSLTLRDRSGLPAWRGQGPESMAGRGEGRGPGPDARGRVGGRGCREHHGRGHHGCRGGDCRGGDCGSGRGRGRGDCC